MLSDFSMFIEYRRYRRRIMRAYLLPQESIALLELKLQINGLFLSLQPYDGKGPITLLAFLGLLMKAYQGINVSESDYIRLLSYFLDGEAEEVYIDQTTPNTSGVSDALTSTWFHVMHAFITRFLDDNVLQAAFNSVKHAQQRKSEEKGCLHYKHG